MQLSQIFTIGHGAYSVLKDLQGALRRVNFKMRFLKQQRVALTVAVCLYALPAVRPELKYLAHWYQKGDYAALDSKVVIN